MLKRKISANFVVDQDTGDDSRFYLAAHDDDRNAKSFEVAGNVLICEEPVCDHDQTFDTPLQHDGQTALELFSLVGCVHDNGQHACGAESDLYAFEDESAEGIGDVEDHNVDGVAALAVKCLSVVVRCVTELTRRDANGGEACPVRASRRASASFGNAVFKRADLSPVLFNSASGN